MEMKPTMYMSVTLNKEEDLPGPNMTDLQRFNHMPDCL